MLEGDSDVEVGTLVAVVFGVRGVWGEPPHEHGFGHVEQDIGEDG
jgi:hypothetical protein